MIMAIIGGHFYKRARTRTRRRHLRFRDESISKGYHENESHAHF